MINNILFPTDFSEFANNALPFALDLAKKNNAKLHIVHVYYTPPSVGIDMAVSPEQAAPSIGSMIYESLEKRMKQFIKDNNISSYDHEHAVLFGIPDEELDRYTEKHEIDLIVMGTKGETALRRLFLGSVAKALIQNAPCPVLAIPGECSFKEIKRITYATDLRFDETRAIEYFIKIAELYEAELILLHLDLNDEERGEHKAKLKQLVEKTDYPRISYNEIIVDDISDGIEHFVQDNNVDMLAMMTTTTSFFDKIFHKSLTTEMLFHAQTPLFAIRREKKSIVLI